MLEEKCWKQRASSTEKNSIGGSAEKIQIQKNFTKKLQKKICKKKFIKKYFFRKFLLVIQLFLEKLFGKFLPVILI